MEDQVLLRPWDVPHGESFPAKLRFVSLSLSLLGPVSEACVFLFVLAPDPIVPQLQHSSANIP